MTYKGLRGSGAQDELETDAESGSRDEQVLFNEDNLNTKFIPVEVADFNPIKPQVTKVLELKDELRRFDNQHLAPNATDDSNEEG